MSGNGTIISSEECDWNSAVGVDINGTGVDETTASNPTQYVYLVLYPFLLLCCTVGSILTIATLWRDKSCRKSSASVYMTCSAIGDLCILWSIVPDYNEAASLALGNNRTDSEVDVLLQYKGFGAFWNEAAIQFVDWTLIVFSIERLVVTLRPLSVQARTASWKKTLIKEFIVLVLAALFSLSYLVTYYYWWTNQIAYPESTFQEVLTPLLRRWYLLQIDAEAGMFIAKWFALLILDVVLMTALWRYRQARKTMVATKSKNNSSNRNANLIVIGSLTLYTLTQCPYVLLQCLKIASRPPYCTMHMSNAQEGRARPVVNIVYWSYYSVVFFIYLASSSKFRQQFRALFGSVPTKKRPQSGKSTVRRSISTDTVMTLAHVNRNTLHESSSQDDLEDMTAGKGRHSDDDSL